MTIKLKRCKGKSRAKDFEGCGEPMIIKEEGLCSNCHRKWTITTKEGNEILNNTKL